MNAWWERLGQLFHGDVTVAPAGTSLPTSSRMPRDWCAPEVAFDLEPHVGRLLRRDEAGALVRTPLALRRSLAIGLRGALDVLSEQAGSRADAVAALRAYAERCRVVCERALEVLLDGAGETSRALAWLAWAFDTPGPFAAPVLVAAPGGAELWATQVFAVSDQLVPLVVWECDEAPGPEVQRAARAARVLLLASEESRGELPTAWQARGGYQVEGTGLPGLASRGHAQWLSTTGAAVQALLAGAGPSGWWAVRPPACAARADALSGLRALRAALGSKVIAMVPREAGSQTMVIPPLFRPGARRPASEPVEQG